MYILKTGGTAGVTYGAKTSIPSSPTAFTQKGWVFFLFLNTVYHLVFVGI